MTDIANRIELGMPHDEYVRDPFRPSLSSSILNLLLSRSPRHAWTASPALNPAWTPSEPTSEMEFGSACHAMLLQGHDDGAGLTVVDADAWRSNAAKEARQMAREAGGVAILRHKYEEAQEIVSAVYTQIAVSEIGKLFGKWGDNGQGEVTATWMEGDTRARARFDWLRNDYALALDMKFTDTNASPAVFARQILNMGYDVQASWYRRGLKAISGVDATFVFVVAEVKPPYAVSLVSLDPGWIDVARRKVDLGLAKWRTCMESGKWPAYDTRIAYASIPPWAEAQVMDMELSE